MRSRFALRIALPMTLFALAFAAVMWVGQASDRSAGMPVVSFASGEKQDAGAPDTSQWAATSRTLDGVTITYRYPSGWSAELTYCAPGANNGQRSGHLPAGCASTDFLVGQKARDVGRIEGTPLTVGGMSASRLVASNPANVVVSQVYTVMVYDASGAPLFGISTQAGYDTDPATLQTITNTLDAMVSTLRVEVSR